MPSTLPERARLLLLEDSDIDAELIGVHLSRSSVAFDVRRAVRRSEFEALLRAGGIDLVLADYSLPDIDGPHALRLARELLPDVPFVFVSGVVGEDIATEALRQGATDYVLKRNLARLPRAVERALAERAERERRRRVEEELRTSEANTRLAVDAAQFGMWHYAPSERSLSWDTRAQAMFGVEARPRISYDELLELIHPEAREATAQALAQAMNPSRGGQLLLETRVQTLAGDEHWLVLRGQAMFDALGLCTRVIGVVQDVTAQRLAEARQRHAEVLFRLAAEAADIGVWDLDVARNELWFDDGVRAIADLPPGPRPDYLEMLRLVVHPEDRDVVQQGLAGALQAGASPDIEYEHRMVGFRDKRVRWVAIKGRRIVGPDGRPRLIGTARDVTEQRRKDEALRRANEALEERVADRTREIAAANTALRNQIEERNRMEDTLRQMQRLEAVGQLTSGVAHDFNNLLTVVLSNIGLIRRLLEQHGAPPDPRVQQRLESMRNAAERGARLTAQLLAFSRRQRLEPQTIDLNDTVVGMRDLLQTTMGGSVRIETELEAGLWPALVDPTQLELIVLNLAINARDAMDVGGTLILRTANRGLTAPPRRPEEPEPGDYVELSVSDTGSGMSPEVLAKAFEPFFTTKEVGKGSGLGLAQVYGFAKQSGGGVRIDTTLGTGTTVHVYIPRAAAAADADAAAALDPPTEPAPLAGAAGIRAAGHTLLLVDDDAAVRDVTASMLVELGYRVIEAGSGPAALAIAEQRDDIDLVVADFAMPGMNGVEMAAALQGVAPRLKVLFLTGFADLAALGHVPEDFVLQKPLPDGELGRRVQRLLRRRTSHNSAPARSLRRG